jgi:hypothetical protein
MIHDVIAYILWGAFFASIILTIPAVMKKSIGLLIVAATLSLIFGIAGLMTVGIFGLLLTCLQATFLVGYALKVRALGWVLLFIAAIVLWVSIWSYVGNPFGWKYTGAELQMERLRR